MEHKHFTLTNEDNEIIGVVNSKNNSITEFSELIQEAIKEHYTATKVFIVADTEDLIMAHGSSDNESEYITTIITLDNGTEPLIKVKVTPVSLYQKKQEPKVLVYFETPNHSYAEVAATFDSEELYLACRPILVAKAKESRMIVTESID
ncbi:hypothetical protein [Wenyingzhuangia sp. 2_MG-2023]|uniref:hypothetical protein n=1 Tax=Wenyingzhuangia sp. 2_MG-2023 TaxID=3062639 RepID=UPI0026E1B4C4|nr:hypothetical protein [Wenyingzhuangia sp. 2_MG-2023]MDO6737057.1 hypothetical protein [Wenyingzhuangia sp. 2_MG-2023]